MSVMSPVTPARAGEPASPPGLSAHAQALWRRAARYRALADDLAAADVREPAP